MTTMACGSLIQVNDTVHVRDASTLLLENLFLTLVRSPSTCTSRYHQGSIAISNPLGVLLPTDPVGLGSMPRTQLQKLATTLLP